MKTYKGLNKKQLVHLIADFSVKKAKINNSKNGNNAENENKQDYINLYMTYPIISRTCPAFSLSKIYDDFMTFSEVKT